MVRFASPAAPPGGAQSTNAEADEHTCHCTRPTARFQETDPRDYRTVVYQMADTPSGQNATFRGVGYNGQVPLNLSRTRDATSQNDQSKAFPHCEVPETLAKSASRSVSLAPTPLPSSVAYSPLLPCCCELLQLTWSLVLQGDAKDVSKFQCSPYYG